MSTFFFFFCLTLLSLHQEFRAFKCGLGCFKTVISTTQCGECRKYKHIKKKMKTIHNPHQVDVNTVNILVCLNRCVFKERGRCVCVWLCVCVIVRDTHTHRHTLWTVCAYPLMFNPLCMCKCFLLFITGILLSSTYSMKYFLILIRIIIPLHRSNIVY